ncbi:MAG: Fic family protein [Mycobacteriales bacterium]|nr:MAG: cell filamentation protein Fic [Pseudonocardiales bacterium]
MSNGLAGAGWPLIATEELRWQPAATFALPSGQARLQAGPYRAAIAPEIATVPDVPLSAETRSLVTEAATEIARFDAEVGADLAPFSAILLRTESVASSRIENLTASAKAIALAELGDTDRANATVIVANTTAMQAAIALADRLGGDAILAMHRALLGTTEPEWAGKWRTVQNWIGGSDWSPHRAMFVPPHPDRVPAAIHDLERFLVRDDLPVLVQAAVAHAQFETIHPFPDGNGRTGRALVHSLLRGKGLTRKVTVPVSAGLLADTSSYFDALTAYRDGDPEPIVERLASASFAAINNGRTLVGDLHALRASWDDTISARRGASAWRLADLVLSQPVVDSPLAQRQLAVTAPAALRAIEQLVDAGVLTKMSGRQRYRRYSASQVLEALDAFAVRAGRRGGS